MMLLETLPRSCFVCQKDEIYKQKYTFAACSSSGRMDRPEGYTRRAVSFVKCHDRYKNSKRIIRSEPGRELTIFILV